MYRSDRCGEGIAAPAGPARPLLAQNRLLAAWPAAAELSACGRLEPVELRAGTVLYQPGQFLRHAYFPLDCIIGLSQLAEDGRTEEMVAVGNEGFVGVALFMGGRAAAGTAVAQTAGHCLRLRWHDLRQELQRSVALERLLLRYAQALYFQAAQAATCRRTHGLRQRACSCLLACADRLGGASTVSPDVLATLLQAGAEETAAAVSELQAAGHVGHRSGRIRIVDRAGLEAGACECYELVRHEVERLVPGTAPIARGRASAPARRPA